MRFLLAPAVLAALGAAAAAVLAVPDGFTAIFDGRSLAGWHISTDNHHGATRAWTVADGVLSGTQDRPGHGGILLTDERYGDFEIALELRPDWGCDGGLFLRSNEAGQAYQVMIDYLEGGSVGGVYGEGLPGVDGNASRNPEWSRHWKKDDWNHLRVRIEGEVPHIQVWMNGQKITDWKDTANHAAGGARDGMVALQVHFSDTKTPRWKLGGVHRYRNIVIRRLP